MDAAWVAALTGLSVAAITALAWLTRHAWQFLRRMVRFLDEFFGTPARDGLPGTPGVMARLGSVEKLVTEVVAEIRPNGGHSMRDDIAAVKTDQAAMRGRMDALELTVKGGKP